MSDLKLLTIREAEKADDTQLFVLNRIKPRGNINITVNDDGERRTVTLPIASVPIDITTMTTKKAMLSNPDFRRLHARGAVQLVSTESAEKLFASNPKARAELERVFNILGTNYNDLDVVPTLPENTTAVNATIQTSEEVNPFILASVARADSDEPVQSLIEDIEAQLDIVTDKDLTYITSNSSNVTLKEWAALTLLQREEDAAK